MAGGILRPSRYSSSKAATADAADDKATGGAPVTAARSARRSLADLCSSSQRLADEAAKANVDRARIISHRLGGPEIRGSGGDRPEPPIPPTAQMATLEMSEESGKLYLKRPAGPEVVDDPATLVGVMEEGGQQVRFYEGDEATNVDLDLNLSGTSRARLEQRMEDDDSGCEDTASESSDGSAHDEEILKELGLEGLVDENTNIFDSDAVTETDVVRPFRLFWEALSKWCTPESIALVQRYQGVSVKSSAQSDEAGDDEMPRDGSAGRAAINVGATRLSSIMSMLKMNESRSLAELKRMRKEAGSIQQLEDIQVRDVEKRLGEFVSSFSPHANAVDLTMKQWRGLTTILIAIVFPELWVDDDDVEFPKSLAPLNLKREECTYLVRSSLTSLGSAW